MYQVLKTVKCYFCDIQIDFIKEKSGFTYWTQSYPTCLGNDIRLCPSCEAKTKRKPVKPRNKESRYQRIYKKYLSGILYPEIRTHVKLRRNLDEETAQRIMSNTR